MLLIKLYVTFLKIKIICNSIWQRRRYLGDDVPEVGVYEAAAVLPAHALCGRLAVHPAHQLRRVLQLHPQRVVRAHDNIGEI